MKKILALLNILFILLIVFSISAQAGIQIWPGELNIDINKWDEKTKEIRYKIQVTNTKSYGFNVIARVENPSIKGIDEGYMIIPDISWIEINQKIKYIEPKSSEFFEVVIRIPEDQKELLYNKKWDVRIIFSSDIFESRGINLKVELAVKLLIETPERETQESRYLQIIILSIIIGIALFLISNYIRRKKKQINTAFYFKKNKKD